MTKGLPSPRECATLLKALGDETRVQLPKTLLRKDQCVSDLAERTKLPQPHVSHHLQILRTAGLVEGHREGQRICYRVTPSVRHALKGAGRTILDFGCCQVRFPVTRIAAWVR